MRRLLYILAVGVLAALGVGAASVLTATESFATCENSVSEALLAGRIVGRTASYARDNPSEYQRVRAYLDGGARPVPPPASHMGKALVALEDTCRGLAPGTTTTTTTTTPGDNVILVNKTFECSSYPQPVNFDLVRVTVNPGAPRGDGFHTGPRCTGRIGRIELITPYDGLKTGPGAHDLVIEGGFIHCHPATGEIHQDGIQAQGGKRITFRNLEINCGGHAAMFVNQGSADQERPEDIICDGCTMRKLGMNNRTLWIYDSLRSGAKNSTIYWCGSGCPGQAVVTSPATVSPVNQNNTPRLYGG